MSGQQYGRRAIQVGDLGRNVAINIRRLREARQLSTRQLSKRLESAGRRIPASGLTRIEQGERRVDIDDLATLALVLDIDPGHLLVEPSTLIVEVRIGRTGGSND